MALVREKSHKKTEKVLQGTLCRRSEHHAVFIGCQHQCCLYYCLRQGTRAVLTLGNAPYRLLCVRFVGSQFTVLAATLRTMDRSNAKLDEVDLDANP